MQTIKLRITGMTCASCVLHIENDLKELKGVSDAVVNLPLKQGNVVFDEKKIGEQEIIKAIKKAGYKAEIADTADSHEHHENSGLREFLAAAFMSAIILWLGFVWEIEYGMEIMMGLSLVILIYSGRNFFLRGIPDLLKGRPAMDTLVALGVGSAFLYSSYLVLFVDMPDEYFMDVAVITTFVLLGRYLESRAKGRAGSAIRKLLELSAKIAHRVAPNGEIQDIPTEEIGLDDLLRVKPGEKIPTDGILTDGYASIDESMVTGESIPVDKQKGDMLIGATINSNTAFTMRATKIGSDTVLSQIIKMVKDAQMSKAPIQKLVDVVAGYFVWGVIGIAAVTFGVWSYLNGPGDALIPTVAVLIIACPCALGLATPISIVVGSGKGAELGILIKKPESLEKAHKITAIAFDKTGTITKGRPEVQEFLLLTGDKKEALNIALSLEEHSEHPLARSVVEFTKKSKARALDVDHFKAIPGLGISGKIKNKTYYFGSSHYMAELKILSNTKGEITALEEKGFTVLCLADDKKILALFGVQDGLKESSLQAISQLKKLNIRTVMLTGDNQKVAQKIAKEVGIDEVHSEITPDKKREIIERLQKEGYFVAMAGDGINDSPALAKADVGIAMGTGTDVAIETGDLVLVKGDLQKAVTAIELSRATLRNIKQNLFWAFFYNSIGIPLAALGMLNPAISAGAMAFSSVSVVMNALRLKRFRIKYK